MKHLKQVLFLFIVCAITVTGLYLSVEPAQAAKCVRNFKLVNCDTVFGNRPKESTYKLPVMPHTYLYLNNQCRHPVRVALSFKSYANGSWISESWWHVGAYSGYYPTLSDQRIEPSGAPIYYYAETTDGSGLQWTGDTPVSYYGSTYYTRSRDLDALFKDGRYELVLTCN